MANVKQCDRCGAIYRYGERRTERFSLFDNSVERNTDRIFDGANHYYTNIGDLVDLCEQCQNELTDWVFCVETKDVEAPVEEGGT